jgi:hypothetical protein
MSFDDRKPKHMHKLGTAHFGAQVAILAGALLLAGAGVGCGDDDSGSGGAGGSGGSAGSAAKAGSGGAGGKAGSGGSSGKGGTGGMCSASAGGPIASTDADKHCIDDNDKKQEVNESACKLPPGAPPPETDADAGAPEFGATLNGAEGDDDDCKYHVKWTASCITENTDFTVTVTITNKVDGKPVVTAAGNLDYELYLEANGDAHLAPNTNAKYKTTSTPGVYTLGPLRVDQAGKWTLRYHIRWECVDVTEDSPHGHVAFFVKVP